MSISINGAGSISGIDQGLNVTGGAIVGGALTVTGVLTYDDVTNIDSIGIVTARSGIHVTGGSVGIGTDNPTNMLDIAGSTPTIELNDTDTGVIHRVSANSSVGQFYFDSDINNIGSDGSFVFRHGHLSGGSQVFSISSVGTLTLGPNSGKIRRSGDIDTYINFDGSNEIEFATANVERLRIASAGQIGLGGTNYGTNNQVITSTGTGSAPEWRGVNAAFYGKQDTAHNVDNTTWTVVKNLSQDAVNTTGWNESTGLFTANADTAGTWYIFGSAGIDDVQSVDVVYAGIMKNGANPAAYTYSRMYSGAANQVLSAPTVAAVVTLADGDTVGVGVYHNEGTTEPTEQNRCFVGGFRLSV